ncbi:MAG: cell division protease FtsH [Gammaproteobacteria bacterium]|jgi:cell division protease FtsH
MAIEKPVKINSWYFVLATIGVIFLQSFWAQNSSVDVIPYSEFQAHLKAGAVDEIIVTEHHVRGTFAPDAHQGKPGFYTTRIDTELARDLAGYDVKITGATENTLLKQIISWVVPAVIFVGLWFVLIRRFAQNQGLGGGMMSIGKSNAKVYMETDTKVTFDSARPQCSHIG